MEKTIDRSRNDGFPANNTHQEDSIQSAILFVSGQKDRMNLAVSQLHLAMSHGLF